MRNQTTNSMRRWRQQIQQQAAHTQREQVRWAVSLLDLQAGDRILEIDCGSGSVLAQIAEDVPGVFATGVNPSAAKLRQAHRRCAAFVQQGWVALHQAEATSLPFPDSLFDKLVVFHSLSFSFGFWW